MKLGLIGVVVALTPMAVSAAPHTISGSANGVKWTAASTVIGQTSTATVAGGGNPIYLAQSAQYRGVVGLLMDYGAGGAFVCSGSLSAGRTSIITAGHCVSDGGKGRPNSVTAFFYNGSPTDQPVYSAGAIGVTRVAIDNIEVNPGYTGNVIDQNDIAVLHLAGPPPAYAKGYDIYTGGDLTGQDYNIAGYGRRSDTGGSVGVNLGTGRLRQGDNRYDFRLGDSDFGGVFTSEFFGESGAQIGYSYIADFDNGRAANDASCGLATGPNPFTAASGPYGFGLAASAKYCNLGRGATEVSTAGGDSGGPQFIDGKLASVTSYGLTFGLDVQPGDIDNALNDSFGEFNGFVPTFIHAAWLGSVVPEPSNWAMMIAGFGLVGAMTRRSRKLVAA